MAKRKPTEENEEHSTNGSSATAKQSGLTIEQSNALSPPEFLHHISGLDEWKTFGDSIITLHFADDLSDTHLKSCSKLIETTSRHDYEPSSFGWHPKRKLREMKEEEMRYLIVHSNRNSPELDAKDVDFQGFLSFMLTHDSSPVVPVLYIYEIHLTDRVRGKGMGKFLVHVAEAIAQKFEVEKVMLTCFKSNMKAAAFYRGLGYDVDACSPGDRRTRNKVVKTDYWIMSKDVKTATKEGDEG